MSHDRDKQEKSDRSDRGDRSSVAQPRDENGLLGDTSEDRNLSGASTYINLPEQGEEEGERQGSKEGREKHADQNPPRTTTGKMTSPKFGSAGGGGAELEPGPERD